MEAVIALLKRIPLAPPNRSLRSGPYAVDQATGGGLAALVARLGHAEATPIDDPSEPTDLVLAVEQVDLSWLESEPHPPCDSPSPTCSFPPASAFSYARSSTATGSRPCVKRSCVQRNTSQAHLRKRCPYCRSSSFIVLCGTYQVCVHLLPARLILLFASTGFER